MNSAIKTVFIFLSVWIGLAVGASAYTGVVTVESATVLPGDQIDVAVNLTSSDTPLAGLLVPLWVSGPGVTIDSVIANEALAPPGMVVTVIDSLPDSAFIKFTPTFAFPLPTIDVSEAELARIYLSIDGDASPGPVYIDSVYHQALLGNWIRIEATDESGAVPLFPGFQRGTIIIDQASGVEEVDPGVIPEDFELSQNYPNPFNPTTQIDFSVARSSHVRLEVFNVLGQSVALLVDRSMAVGSYTVDFDATGQPSGIYFYRLTHDSGTQTRKMVLIK